MECTPGACMIVQSMLPLGVVNTAWSPAASPMLRRRVATSRASGGTGPPAASWISGTPGLPRSDHLLLLPFCGAGCASCAGVPCFPPAFDSTVTVTVELSAESGCSVHPDNIPAAASARTAAPPKRVFMAQMLPRGSRLSGCLRCCSFAPAAAGPRTLAAAM